jgi:hypothetical protein
MKFFVSALATAVLSMLPVRGDAPTASLSATQTFEAFKTSPADRRLERAFRLGLTEFKIRCVGKVIRKLTDDDTGIRHQRFIIELSTGQTLLIVHNIDLSKRIKRLNIGDKVVVKGEYIWNSQGGLMHLTHRDPDGVGFHGYIRHRGKLYQ